MRNVSAAFKQAMFDQSTDSVFLVLLTLSHPDLPSDIRLVNNRQSVVSGGETYSPYAFGVDMPGDSEGRVSAVYLVIDNTDRSIVQAVRSINDAPTVTIRVVLASAPNTVELGPFEYRLRDVQFTKEEVRGQLVFMERLAREIPAHRFVARDFPGLYV
jgi:hypothetical protein